MIYFGSERILAISNNYPTHSLVLTCTYLHASYLFVEDVLIIYCIKVSQKKVHACIYTLHTCIILVAYDHKIIMLLKCIVVLVCLVIVGIAYVVARLS